MSMSHHASVRCQQRAIPQMVVDLLLQFGAAEPAGDGTRKIYFDKTARRRVKAYAGTLANLLNDHLNVYAVVSADEQIITTAHLLNRVRRH